MQTSLKQNIRNALLVESGTSLVDMDSEANPNGHQFPTIHFDYYARNGTRVSSPLTSLFFNFLIFYVGRYSTIRCPPISLTTNRGHQDQSSSAISKSLSRTHKSSKRV